MIIVKKNKERLIKFRCLNCNHFNILIFRGRGVYQCVKCGKEQVALRER